MSAISEWNSRANDLFLQAVEIEDFQRRRSFLDGECGEDAPLRQQVESLLAASEQVGNFLNEPAAPVVREEATADWQPIPEGAGTVIGPYKLLQVIGEGGMGVVYMAEQVRPVERRVALKIIKPGMDTRQVIARFEAERQALALMDHPNIAKVFDGGTTTSGHPYFVMELVKGVPITQYCDEKHLTLRERLALFMPVCQAIQHAHQKGIIHRDIKPSNVLIAQYDGEAVPKVIDFGVAKATIQRLTDKTMFTQFGQLVGTFEYMSPEQAQLNQLDIDTRSDVYSLGVLLYELLTGETPFDKLRLRSAALDEMLRIIREEEPPRPSTKISSAATLPAIAANRGTDSAKLGRSIRGELDWIVMKALDKDRSRRYESAASFEKDVERFLICEPVLACPPSTTYRLSKFARRNSMVLAATFVVVMALLVGGSVGLWQAFEADKARALADQRSRLQRSSYFETTRGSQVIHLLTVRRQQLDEATRETLDRIASRIEEEPRLRDNDLHGLRNDLMESILGYWEYAIRIDTSPSGEPQGQAELYYRQRALCLARAGENRKAAAEAELLWQNAREPMASQTTELAWVDRLRAAAAEDESGLTTKYADVAQTQARLFEKSGYGAGSPFARSGEMAYDLARVYALCARTTSGDEALTQQYADRAIGFLGKSLELGFFEEKANAKKLRANPDFTALRTRKDFAVLVQSVDQ